ncbi:MAG: phytoene desaturase family protein [Kineosporiaceae bacterium]
MPQQTADAVVIGAGPNGLVAACTLADAGWDVLVVEANAEVGGAVRSERRVEGYVHDLYSSFYPLAAASPVLARLDLDRHGLRWRHAPAVVAHLLGRDDERAAVLHRDVVDTATGLDADHPGDGDAWIRLFEHWRRIRDPLLDALFSPFPPVKAGAALVGRLGVHDTLWTLRMFALPVHRLCQELFGGRMATALVTGNALHADVPAVAPVSGVFGWLLVMLGQDVGFPVPEGGAGMLAEALASRARSAGATIRTGSRVERVVVRNGRALGVVTGEGLAIRARRAVLADVPAPTLLGRLVRREDVPARVLEALERFQWDLPTVKVNWALDGPIPWRAAGAELAGTVHLGGDADGLALSSAALDLGRQAFHDFLIVGQMATADPSRAPLGDESVWSYSHLPRGVTDAETASALAKRMDQAIEAHAPGFHDRVIERWVQLPSDIESGNASLVNGTINGGTAQLHQQLVFRPLPGLGRAETPIDRLYLAGSSAHPGGGVHGAAGSTAARAALNGAGPWRISGRLRGRATRQLEQMPRHAFP